eukprot:2581355-Amphidinium_carterae.1
MQLNSCEAASCSWSEAFESLRAAQVLVNGACLLSEPSDKLDEEDWSGMVTFVPSDNVSKVDSQTL